MTYHDIIEEIVHLSWNKLNAKDLQRLMYASEALSREMAEAVRCGLQLHPEDRFLQEMAKGEIGTSNISFQDFRRKADHSEFLLHFLNKSEFRPDEALKKETQNYLDLCRDFSAEVRLMTVVSREKELPPVFAAILDAQDWEAPGLDAYKYFLTEHVRLDSEEAGHHELIKHIPTDERIEGFYQYRLDLFRKLFPVLYEKGDTPVVGGRAFAPSI